MALDSSVTLGLVTSPGNPSRRTFTLYGLVPDSRRWVKVLIGRSDVRHIHVHDDVFVIQAKQPVVEDGE